MQAKTKRYPPFSEWRIPFCCIWNPDKSITALYLFVSRSPKTPANTGIFSAAREETVCFHAVFLSPAFLLRQLDEFKKASKPGISAAHHTSSERRPVVCRSALSARSPSAHGLPGRFAPDTPLQTASVYVKIVLDTQNCILFCVFKFLFGTFAQNPSLMFVGFYRRSPPGERG